MVEQGFAKVLAQPSLITTSGRPASIHVGGEFPILVPQEVGTVSIEWREFGVRAEVVPVVLDNGRLRLDLAPEISERDFSNSVQVEGTVVPGITTRRVNTQVELEFGQTLVIGGLTSTSESPLQGIPIANKVPYVSKLLKAVPTEKRLIILATPKRVDASNK
jgi:pilus assembly protein CpaC